MEEKEEKETEKAVEEKSRQTVNPLTPIQHRSGGAGAWSNGLDSGSSGVGLRGFKSRPPHLGPRAPMGI